jgi:hypothetical protein
MTDAKIIPLRAGLEPSPAPGDVNPEVVKRLTELLDQAKSGEIAGIAYATLHPGDMSCYSTCGRTTRGLLGALVILQHEMSETSIQG